VWPVVGLTVLLLSAECRDSAECADAKQAVSQDMAGRGGPWEATRGKGSQAKSGEVRPRTSGDWRGSNQGVRVKAFRPLFPPKRISRDGGRGRGTGVFCTTKVPNRRLIISAGAAPAIDQAKSPKGA
jgi:hypothetical protein